MRDRTKIEYASDECGIEMSGRKYFWIMFSVIAFLLFFAFNSIEAAGIYILDGGTGNGTSWSSPLDQVPTNMTGVTRGDTLYYGDGSYSAVSWNKAVSGTTNIFVIKATASNHGSDTGWDAAYGDGVATFSGTPATWTVSTDYWVFDGMTGSGTTGHGFKLTTTGTTVASKLITIAAGVNNVTISHVEGQHAGMNTGYSQDCIYANGVSGAISYITVSYCYFHDVTRVHVYGNNITNSVFEYNYFERRSDAAIHGESFSMNSCTTSANDTLRFNIFKDIVGTGYLVFKDSVQGGFVIYGNVFYATDKPTYWASNGLICNTSGDTNTDMLVYNNTAYNLAATSGSAALTFCWWANNSATNLVKNNIAYLCGSVKNTNVVDDYNAADAAGTGWDGANNVTITTNPFINSAGYDFTLNAHGNADSVYNKGVTLGSPYNVDIVGLARPQNTGYDIGAYELYQAPESPDPPTAPATQIIRPTWATLTWTPTDSTVIEINGVASDTLAVTDSSCIIITTPHTRYTVVFKTLTDGVVYGGSSVSFTTPGKTVGRGTRKRIQ